MDQRDTFLSRWSRLKRGADTAPAHEADAAPQRTPAQEQPLPEGKALEDLIASLPRVEDLVPGQNLGDFMQAWVPTALRNAALQRMWLLDPAISGYVDPALDYAYDYNAIGGAPGFGPMETSREAISEVAEMFDRALGKTTGPTENDRPLVKTETATVQNDVATSHDSLPALPDTPTPAETPTPPQSADAATHNNASHPNDLRPTARRHGGALPG